MLKAIYLFPVFLAIFVCGCVTTYTGSITKFPERTKFDPIPNAKLKLEPVGRRELISGVDDSITLKLTNIGRNTIRIEEWYMKEVDNFIVYYQPWKPGTTAPDPLAWEVIYPVTLDRPKRYPLDMSPGVSVLVRFGLPFVDGLKVTPGKERRFFLRATLSLRTVKAESEIFAISVL
ncbi:MAG: hypothetical protein IKB71_02470 [Lentisphaeria bacterium]|nr:hypothetical protein [Lentisphaeria bacterium]